MGKQNYVLSTRLADHLKAFLPTDATSVMVHDIRPLREQGASSLMYSFLITYVSQGLEQEKSFVLRVYHKGYAGRGKKEFELLKVLKEHNLPVPTAYCYGTNGGLTGNQFLVMEKIEGKSVSHIMNDETNARFIVDKMAEILFMIHKLSPNLIRESNILQEEYELKQRDLLKMRLLIKTCRMDFLCISRLQRRFVAAVRRLEDVKPKRFSPAILHSDFEPHHVLISNKQLTVVDWGEALVGDPMFDVAFTYHFLRLGKMANEVDLGEYFVRCYEKRMSQELVNLQFHKDMCALFLALWSGLLPFQSPRLLSLGRVNSFIRNVFGNFWGEVYRQKLQKKNGLSSYSPMEKH